MRGEVYVHTKRGPILGKCRDLSLGGISLEVSETRRIAGKVRVVTSFDGQLLDLDAVVARRRRAGSVVRLGLRFDGRKRPVPPLLKEIVEVVKVHAGLARQSGLLAERLPRFVPIGPQIPDPKAFAASAPVRRPPAPSAPETAAAPSQPVVPAASRPLSPDMVSIGLGDGWQDEELETTQYTGRESLPGKRRTIVGSPVPARTGHTVVAPMPQGPARTGATVLSPRVELDDDDAEPTGRAKRRRRR